MVELRRAIHAEPELGLFTPRTSARVRAALADLPLEWREGPSTSGLVALLRGPANGRTVLLRADMDALPMPEETGLSFASTVPGAMHACGHDAHTAMLVGAARLLCARREALAGSVLFMFQPGEEGHHGARHMLDDGLIDPLPDAAFALHVMPNAPHGMVGGRPGPLLASADRIQVIVTGRGGHASMPHDALDPVPVACAIVGAFQTFVTREVPVFDPAVVTITRVTAGTTHNVIPETAVLEGTIRTLSARRRAAVQAGLRRVAEGVAAAHGASAEVRIEEGFPVTVCDPRAVAFAKATVEELFAGAWRDLDAPIMGAEDFAYVLERVPGAMFFLGAAAEGADWQRCCPLHSTRMALDETVMARGAAVHAALALRFLEQGFAA
ncbi:MAG: M20 family metallopeptidase [Sphingomonadaceae bacterium]|uniref:M20 metallopeptidase family protein n=1 Tax=Thermaurantiacus sp. TaxID=2820283 RepID=UPI00298EEDAE|nr:M20 family metallopeptidase [Thermaurantiacus sp.]MCS6986078.1 M20 family metallopeptidase [Sphingomonadaceae bacterium]MDW8414706.1 M20 family metallopeptidase [Thermaurantiacus sp.]